MPKLKHNPITLGETIDDAGIKPKEMLERIQNILWGYSVDTSYKDWFDRDNAIQTLRAGMAGIAELLEVTLMAVENGNERKAELNGKRQLKGTPEPVKQ
jgi:hypothetical protein